MKNVKVKELPGDEIVFTDGTRLFSDHDQDCCENHYLDFSNLELTDFEGLEFDLSNDNFLQKVDGYGIRLVPLNGHAVSIPGYGSNNGYYSTNLTLVVLNGGIKKTFDVTECQVISD